ncbi:MAG: pantoate--beta-alanine ligase [Flavobacteriales bacterium]|nr:MAG: pantoate--beta-alanine ligase [Flavobacteriales bacterium]
MPACNLRNQKKSEVMLEVFQRKSEIFSYCSRRKSLGKTIGFVPTMGALHTGHLQLVNTALEQNDLAVVSIFVNPTQFNSAGDLLSYPRQFDQDLKMLESLGSDKIVIFNPDVQGMYPDGMNNTGTYDLNGIDSVMEGAHRPGHFQGVATIVHKLFSSVEPHKAYFGEKDFQQLAIIRHITKTLNLPIDIISVPTIREDDGLAKSSRNALLSEEHRAEAHRIYATMTKVKNKFDVQKIDDLIEEAIHDIQGSDNLFKVEYIEIVDENTLRPSANPQSPLRLFAAVWANKVRLIDNISLI